MISSMFTKKRVEKAVTKEETLTTKTEFEEYQKWNKTHAVVEPVAAVVVVEKVGQKRGKAAAVNASVAKRTKTEEPVIVAISKAKLGGGKKVQAPQTPQKST